MENVGRNLIYIGFSLAAAVLISTITTGAKASPPDGARAALLLGIEDYPVAGDLGGAAKDVCELAKVLGSTGVARARILVLTNPTNCIGAKLPPTHGSELSVLLKSFVNSLSPGTDLLVAFSGHGSTREGEPILHLSDDPNGVIRVSELLSILRPAAQTGRLVLLIDACRNTLSVDQEPGRKADDRFLSLLRNEATKNVENIAVLVSASAGEISWMRSHEPISYFTWSVIKGLLGGAVRSNGTISVGSLADYVSRDVPEQVRYDFGAIEAGAVWRQRPQLYTSSDAAREIEIGQAARGGGSFFWTAEVLIQPEDETGRQLDEPFHIDLVTKRSGRKIDDALPLDVREVFPGRPNNIHYEKPLSQPVANWGYLVRVTFGYGLSRQTFILCPATPNVRRSERSPIEVQVSFDNGRLTLDDTGAYRLWGHYLQDGILPEDMPDRSNFSVGKCATPNR